MEKKGLSKETKKNLIQWVVIIVAAFVLAKLVTTFVIEKITTPTGSMEETIMTDTDKVLMNKLSYLFSSPKRGDIVVFENPNKPGEDLLKRVIGLPGETISFADGHVFINGIQIQEDYVNGKETLDHGTTSYTIPDHCYFMMGDNRTSSADARGWDIPFVDEDAIEGRVFMRYSPSIKFFDRPSYPELDS